MYVTIELFAAAAHNIALRGFNLCRIKKETETDCKKYAIY